MAQLSDNRESPSSPGNHARPPHHRRAAAAYRFIDNLAGRRGLACVLVGLLAVVLRLSLLPLRGPPQPSVHDEFSYLLQGETFAMGRITNPTHPLWPFFETAHVIQRPTYASKFPPGQATFLALGIRLFGNPWYGVLLSVGVMCACICWMVQGWLPPRYGVIAGILAALQMTASYWENSYWGGAVAAAGGALLLGSMPRLWKRPSSWHGSIGAFGIVILMNTRPFEGMLLIIGAVPALLFGRRGAFRRVLCPRVLSGALVVLSVGALAMAYYNKRITGAATELPFSAYQRQYGVSPVFWIQPVPTARAPVQRDLAMEHLRDWELELYNHARRNPLTVVYLVVASTFLFLNGPMLVMLGFTVVGIATGMSRRFRPVLLIGLWFAIGVLIEKAMFPHYLAPATPLLFLFTAVGVQAVRVSRFGGSRAGPLFVNLMLVASAVSFIMQNVRTIDPVKLNPLATRVYAQRRLGALRGRHVVLVRYAPDHDFHHEYVYNGPDIDNQHVIWAIDRGVQADSVLERYYNDRSIWMLEPDRPQPYLVFYGGRRPDELQIDSLALR